MQCKSTKEIWDNIQNIYEGDGIVKKEKQQTHRGHFAILKMMEDDNNAVYFIRVDEVVNTIEGIGEEVLDATIVQKVFRTLTIRFDSNFLILEDRKDVVKFKMYELHGILIAYEMGIDKENPSKREASFKASKKTK